MELFPSAPFLPMAEPLVLAQGVKGDKGWTRETAGQALDVFANGVPLAFAFLACTLALSSVRGWGLGDNGHRRLDWLLQRTPTATPQPPATPDTRHHPAAAAGDPRHPPPPCSSRRRPPTPAATVGQPPATPDTRHHRGAAAGDPRHPLPPHSSRRRPPTPATTLQQPPATPNTCRHR
eukprot:SAG25_NODE_2801_length_1379_cov_62.604687_1_plen_177_part_01